MKCGDSTKSGVSYVGNSVAIWAVKRFNGVECNFVLVDQSVEVSEEMCLRPLGMIGLQSGRRFRSPLG